MATYCVTFRISEEVVGTADYQERYDTLMQNADAVIKGGHWAETTSFFLMESTLLTQDLCKQLAKGLSKSKDLLVVFDPADMSVAYFGAVEHPEALCSFFRFQAPIK